MTSKEKLKLSKNNDKDLSKNSKDSDKNVNQEELENLFYASPIYDFLYPFKSSSSQWMTQYIIILFALILKSAVGLGSYSGMGIPPMFGDFEAQRHWMELTQYLPIKEWYWFDLEYWGLDYPPLTAYHSYILGKIGTFFYPNWFKLNASRGIETDGVKNFMRLTVIASEIFCYIPAIIYFSKWVGRHKNQDPTRQCITAAAILFQPSLMLIDHGHFQYNCVMLGLTVFAINNLLDEFYPLAAFCFVLSICFKQMALYYAPIFFAILLSKSLFSPRFNIARFISVAIGTIVGFLTMFMPLYVFGNGLQNVIQSIHRIFPFARGIFEDKVANFWCVTNIVFKYKILFTQNQLQLYSLIATLVGFFPAMLIILMYPKKHLLPYALTCCSMSFYLFSFQVHEKTILVPLLPITLLFTTSDKNVLSIISWINNIAFFTLWPLLKKDGLVLQYYAVVLMYNWLLGNFSFATPRFLPKYFTPGPSMSNVDQNYRRGSLLPNNILWKIIIILSYFAIGSIHVLELFWEVPPHYPDIIVLLNCVVGFGCFVLFWFWSYYKLLTMRNSTIQEL